MRSSPSASRLPPASGSSHRCASAAVAAASSASASLCFSRPRSFLSVTFRVATGSPRRNCGMPSSCLPLALRRLCGVTCEELDSEPPGAAHHRTAATGIVHSAHRLRDAGGGAAVFPSASRPASAAMLRDSEHCCACPALDGGVSRAALSADGNTNTMRATSTVCRGKQPGMEQVALLHEVARC